MCLSSVKLVKKLFILLVMSGTTPREVWMYATSKHVNHLFLKVCNLTGCMIYISRYKQHLRSDESETRYFSDVLLDKLLAVNLER